MMELRSYQQRTVDSFFANRSRATMVVAPTGSGKTVIGRAIASRYKNPLWVCHRRELLSQCGQRAVSIQSLIRGETSPEADFIVLDECHHTAAAEWKDVWRRYTDTDILGLTATPERVDGASLGDMFDRVIVAANYGELIEQGHLMPCTIYAAPYKGKALAKSSTDLWVEHDGRARKTVVFCPTVKEAEDTAEELNRAGASAASIDGELDSRERDARLLAFAQGRINVLTNVYVLTEGWDCPSADMAIISRSVGHITPWLQMCGRVLRPSAGKQKPLILDPLGNVWNHGYPTMNREFSLTRGIEAARRSPGIWQCKACGYCADAKVTPCPKCGGEVEHSKPLVVKARNMVFVCPKCQTRHDRIPLVCHGCDSQTTRGAKVSSESKEKRLEYLDAMKRLAASKGYKEAWAVYRYKGKYGVFPWEN